MDIAGLTLCSRYAYPPNSLSLCGPQRQHDLFHYAATGSTDRGTTEVLSQFATLYPYLALIAYENDIRDPFDRRVVEAYWIGNRLLSSVPKRRLYHHLADRLGVKRKVTAPESNRLFAKLDDGMPHHSFHVLNVYRRTGHQDIPHTIGTMDACLINWGTIIAVSGRRVTIATQGLIETDGKLRFGPPTTRTIEAGWTDTVFRIGDTVSYHWGHACTTLTARQKNNLERYTALSLSLANRHRLS